jgi:hypothetical protein
MGWVRGAALSGVAAWLVSSLAGVAPLAALAQQERPPAAAPGAPAAPAEAPAPPPEPAWVSGELRMNFRALPSPTSTPLGVVKTGDEVRVLERRGSWARVQVGDGSSGWLPDSALAAVPPPREHVAQLEARVAELQQKLGAADRDAASLRAQVAELSGKDAEREEAMRRLRDENRDLRAGERWPYLITGAAILGIGFVLGRILFRGGSRRSYSRIR